MSHRPIAVTIIGVLFILVGVGGLAAHAREINPHHLLEMDLVLAAVTRLLAIVAGIFMLLGHNWARWLGIGWMAFHVYISIGHPHKELATHCVMLALLLIFLLQRRVNEYFAGKAEAAS